MLFYVVHSYRYMGYIQSANQVEVMDALLLHSELRREWARASPKTRYGKYAGLPGDADLSDAVLDAKCSIRFQTTFLPVDSGSSDWPVATTVVNSKS